jgi:HK97 family phage major capsid protein
MSNTRSDSRFGGFNSFGDFLQVVAKAPGYRGAGADTRLVPLASGPGVLTSEGAGADGGFSAPPGFLGSVIDVVAGPTSILGRCTLIPSERNQVTIPASPTAPWDTSKGVQVSWAAEGTQLTGSKVSLEGRVLRSNKLIALVPVTDDILEDAPALGAHIEMEAPKRLDYTISEAILNGAGTGRPSGLLNAAAKITVSKETSQTAATFNATNAQKMVGRLHAQSMAASTWIMNPDVYQQVAGFGFPVYAPAGVSGYAMPTLLGIPIIQHPAAKALGTEGDVILTDLGAYLTIRRARADFSTHLYFDYDVSAFRFIIRCGGLPLWDAAITPPNSSVTRSSIVTLQSR